MLFGLAVVILLVALAEWLVKGTRRNVGAAGDFSLRVVDAAAFRNLINQEDDLFLKNSLPRKYYWTARRARTRAIQQYLLWIANECASMQLVLRSLAGHSPETHVQARSLSATALRLRLASLGLWSSLWFQRIFPQLDLMPGSVINAYDKLAVNLNLYLAPLLSRRVTSAHFKHV